MKQCITRSCKKVCSLLLVFALSFGGVTLWHAEKVSAAGLTETSLTYNGIWYREGDVLITLEIPDDITLGADYWSNKNQILIDGTAVTSSEWYYYRIADHKLWLIIPNKYFGGATTADEVKAKTHSIVIPKGSSIGSDLKAKEDTAIILNSAGGKQVKPVTLGFQAGGADNNNKRYLITLSLIGADSTTWGNIWNDTDCVIDGVKCTGKFEWANLDGNLTMVIKYAALEPSTSPDTAEGVGEHEIVFPAGTVIGDMFLTSDCRVGVNGYSITKGPDVVLKSSVYSGNAREMNLVMDQVDDLSTTGWTEKAFTEGGISLNGVLGTNTLTFCKQKKESKLYNVWFNGSSLSLGTIMTIDGKIIEGDYCAKFERTHFKYTESGWKKYTPTELSITGIYQCQESGDQYLIYLKTDAEVPGSEGHPYGVTVDINGTSTTQWAQKVADAEQNLWLLPIPKSAFSTDGTEASVTVKAKKEIMSNQGDNYEIVTVNSDFTFSLQEVLLGDALEDRNLDVKDIVRLKRYLADETVSVGKGADADGNGSIDATDRTKLYEYLLSGQKVYKTVTTVQ